MSPVFRHGRLRLYLLKLLDEAPRHGYEVIRLLQDRFMGVYAPSPGTIYPRLARLEEEGLVTHDEKDGKKVYRITGKGREELRARADDLSELEEEITASVRDIAREVTEDVRETVRSLREELTWAARDIQGRGKAAEDPGRRARDDTRRLREEIREQARQARGRARPGAWDDATRDAGSSSDEDAPGGRGERADRPWESWWDWQGWAGWPGRRGWPGPPGSQGWADPASYRDLERMAKHFVREIRDAAWHAQAVSEEALGDLRGILDEALARIRTEVFHDSGPTDGHEDG